MADLGGFLSYTQNSGGPPVAAPGYTIYCGNTSVTWRITVDASWLGVSPASGTCSPSSTVNVAVSASASLAAGKYTATVVVTASNGFTSTAYLYVTVTCPPSGCAPLPPPTVLTLQPGLTDFRSYLGFPSQQTSTLAITGPLLMSWTATAVTTSGGSWLKLSASSGQVPASITATIDSTGLATGTYAGTITVSAPSQASVATTINLVVAKALVVQVSTTSASLTDPVFVGTTYLASPTVSLSVLKFDGTSLKPNADEPWSAASDSNWLTFYPTTGKGTGTFTLNVTFPAGSAYGNYTGRVTISSPTATFDPESITVSVFLRSRGAFWLPDPLNIQAIQGATNCQDFTFYASGGSPLLTNIPTVSVPWIAFPSAATSTPLNGGVVYSPCYSAATLSAGVYTGQIQVLDQSKQLTKIPVQFTVTPAPVIKVAPSTLSFVTYAGQNPPSQTVQLTNSGGGTLNWNTYWTQPAGGAWWSLSPGSGTGDGSVTVQVNSVSLPVGSYTGTINFFGPGALNAPLPMNLTLTVNPGQPVMALTSASLAFVAARNANPSPQTVQVNNTGTGSLGWTAAANTQAGGSWLSVSPATGVAPSTLTLTVNSSTLSPGVYQGSVTVSPLSSANAANGPQVLQVTLTVGTPSPTAGGLTNGASFSGAAIASGSIVSLFGVDLAGNTSTSAGLPLPTTLAATQVLVGGTAAPLFYVSPQQINFQLPLEVSGASTLAVTAGTLSSSPIPIQVRPVAPGIFTGAGNQAAALNSDYSANSPGNPAAAGGVIQLYVTGLGATNPPLATGQAGASGPPNNLTVVNPIVTIGGTQAVVAFSGMAPGFVGLYQVNATIPAAIPAGSAIPVTVSAGGQLSNTATIAVH
jgi:uncharacterized protein (TIGR03437 family)